MNIEEFVNDYLQEHRHDVLLNPYNGLIDFANAFKNKMTKEAVEGRVSEELEEASSITAEESKALQEEYTYFLAKGLKENQPRPIGARWFSDYAQKRFKEGAQWQKDKDEKDLDDMLTVEYLRGAEWGKKDTKEQMMKEAVEGVMDNETEGIIYLKNLPKDYSLGEKVKLIIVKENE